MTEGRKEDATGVEIVRSAAVPEGTAFVLGDWLVRDENGEPTGEINPAGVIRVDGIGGGGGS